MPRQLALFESPDAAAPDGFRYQPELLAAADEEALLAEFSALPFERFQFHQYTGNRRIVSFGWKYDYTERSIYRVDDIPEFLIGVRAMAAEFAGLEPARLQQALVTEYSAGAAIGWHRDKAVYGEIVGISLLAPCTFRLRRKSDDRWERFNLTAMPRSMYLLSGASRSEWEHSIPPVAALRYSITFRNLKGE